jgi:hypothetical protein
VQKRAVQRTCTVAVGGDFAGFHRWLICAQAVAVRSPADDWSRGGRLPSSRRGASKNLPRRRGATACGRISSG